MSSDELRSGGRRGSRRIAIIGNGAFSLSNFRGELIQEMARSGDTIYALAPDFDHETRRAVRAVGAIPYDISLDRTGLNPLRDAADTIRLAIHLRRLKVDLVFSYFIKPVIFGTLAAWLARVPRRFALVAGLGYIFTPGSEPDGLHRRALRLTAASLYKLSFGLCDRVIFQNDDDIAVMVERRVLGHEKTALVGGSGVDLTAFPLVNPTISPITFVLVARMLREKGVREFVTAARIVRANWPEARFVLVGGLDPNPGALSQAEMQSWVAEGTVDWTGQVSDVREYLAQSSVFVLPSYREGKPRSTQEAMAMGLPVITTETAGCRDTVDEGVNGFKVPVRDAEALASAMERFCECPSLIVSMGEQSRRIAQERFDVHTINGQMLEIMGLKEATD